MDTKKHPATELSARRLLVDGATTSALFAALVLGSLAYDPMIWYRDYPAAMRAQAGPQTRRGKRLAYLLVGPVLLVAVGSLVVSNLRLKRQNGGHLSFGAALINAYALFTLVNLFDTVVLDYLVLTQVQPRFAFLPGTEEMNMADYAPPAVHAVNFLKGCGVGAPAAVLVAWITRSNGESPRSGIAGQRPQCGRSCWTAFLNAYAPAQIVNRFDLVVPAYGRLRRRHPAGVECRGGRA